MRNVVIVVVLIGLFNQVSARRHPRKSAGVRTPIITCPIDRHLTTLRDGEINMILECRIVGKEWSENEGVPRVQANCSSGQTARLVELDKGTRGYLECVDQ